MRTPSPPERNISETTFAKSLAVVALAAITLSDEDIPFLPDVPRVNSQPEPVLIRTQRRVLREKLMAA